MISEHSFKDPPGQNEDELAVLPMIREGRDPAGSGRGAGFAALPSSRNQPPANAGTIEPTTASGLRARRRSRHVSGKSPT